jgi:AraC-like DNA-binding protein
MQVLPSNKLSPFIKHFLFLSSGEKDIRKFRLFSDGNTGMVFSFGHQLMTAENNILFDHLPRSFLYGQLTQFKDIYLVPGTTLIIVVFQPSGLHQLMQIPAGELREKIIPADSLFGKEVTALQQRLSTAVTVTDNCVLLNAFFTDMVTKKTLSNQLITVATLHFINKHRGLISMPQLVKLTGYTERHIERKFQESVGIAPKKFAGIVKLHHFLKLLKEQSNDENFAGLAYAAGYADQSHLIKEFRKYTGVTPTQYSGKTQKLASNFVALVTAENTSL